MVRSVENHPAWAARVRFSLSGRTNVALETPPTELDFIDSVTRAAPFDIYVIDCQSSPTYARSTEELRIACLEAAFDHSRGQATFIVDNTDANPKLDDAVNRLFLNRRISYYGGWVPGILHPNETCVVHGDHALRERPPTADLTFTMISP
jgi:hypothetical protein